VAHINERVHPIDGAWLGKESMAESGYVWLVAASGEVHGAMLCAEFDATASFPIDIEEPDATDWTLCTDSHEANAFDDTHYMLELTREEIQMLLDLLGFSAMTDCGGPEARLRQQLETMTNEIR
jgi:hypothetical protein